MRKIKADNIHTLLIIAATLPVSTATAERTFSSLPSHNHRSESTHRSDVPVPKGGGRGSTSRMTRWDVICLMWKLAWCVVIILRQVSRQSQLQRRCIPAEPSGHADLTELQA